MSALNGVRIVELAESVAGEYCGKLLADFGAEVIKVEKPGSGSPTRAITPASVFAYLNTNKRSVVLDVAGEETADGTHVNQWGWQGKPHQEFTIVPVVAAADTAKGAGGKGKDGAAGAGGKGKKKKS